ncbi:MAG: carboxypeptidase-like regulatory domain-containing protein [Bacteroidetes bacterium]|nr:carboxypeptidase-like regulatory domain-containing protein [Bacteroidota bacterium]
MKQKLLILAITLMGYVAAHATNDKGPQPCGDGNKDELNGKVLDGETKKPLKDVTVTAYLISKKEKFEITDEDGGFAFDDLKPGTYKFVFEKAGFRKVTKDKVVIKTDEAFQLNIEMIENPDYEIMPSPFHVSGF